jgi:hypothetical protein
LLVVAAGRDVDIRIGRLALQRSSLHLPGWARRWALARF